MSNIEPVERKWRVNMSLDEARAALVKALELLKGRAVTSVTSSGAYIKYDFGSLLKSRLLGEFWVSRETLPKKVEIYLARINESQTEVNLLIRETHKYAFKWGFVDKYKRALQELADAIQTSVQ
jgi:hypothetical protein